MSSVLQNIPPWQQKVALFFYRQLLHNLTVATNIGATITKPLKKEKSHGNCKKSCKESYETHKGTSRRTSGKEAACR